MTKARDLANLIAAGNPLADGAISVAEISGLTASAAELNKMDGVTVGASDINSVTTKAPTANPTFTGTATAPTINASTALQIGGVAITSTAAELNYNDITALGTVQASKVVTADANGDVLFPDGEKLKLGANSDLTMYHDGSNSYLQDDGDGYLLLTSNGPGVRINSNVAEVMGDFVPNGAVTLYHDNAAKFATTSVGADVTGELIADSYNETYAALSGTSPAVNCHNGNSFSLVLSGNTTFTFTNPPASGTAYSFSVEIIQDSGGSGYTVTWPSSVDWPAATAPTLTATASAKDIFVFTTRDGGTNWYGFTAGQALG